MKTKYISDTKIYRVSYNDHGVEGSRVLVDHKAIQKWWDGLTFDERIKLLNRAAEAGHENPCMFEVWGMVNP